ncbi:PAS domain S-box-containing protein [Mucilaginibacter gracilis]|uniref:PAS sensor protein n=2 Tax=Mucilaginibacter TaxID=423349 RepID=H1YHS6_9SPHI|nr:PAS sensor protein [Mucilaginibacter paludis DSM 18603]RKR81043.1 PAS domain S-box-containing protein [Mucilaginibacter gracilis]
MPYLHIFPDPYHEFIRIQKAKIVKLFSALNFSQSQKINDVLKLAAETANVPMVTISLMGKDTQFIKSNIGLDVDEGSRETSFCKYLLDSKEVLVVPDTLVDDRFMNNPAVVSYPDIRFYAGAPLISNAGYHIGSLCVYDQIPHIFTKSRQQILGILATQVMHIMELELAVILADKRINHLANWGTKKASLERKLRAFFERSPLCHTLISPNFRILDFNIAAATFIKDTHDLRLQVGKNIRNYLSKTFRVLFSLYFKKAVGGEHIKQEVLIKNDAGVSKWWEVSLDPVTNEAGQVTSIAYNATNINDRKMQLPEISAQNKALSNIAYIQSHQYRRPVASILGLFELIRADNYQPDRECLILMEKAVNELDLVIKQVVDVAGPHTSKVSA